MYFLAQLLDLYAFGLLIYVILSWFNHPTAIKIRDALGRLYLPLLNPLRSALKPVVLGGTAIDISPLVLLLGIVILRRILLWF